MDPSVGPGEAGGVAVPRAAGHAAREAAGPYGIARESDEAYIRRWNREHRPDSWDRMLERRQSFERLEEARKQTRPPSGPHDTLDAILKQVRDELGQRALAVIAIDETNPHMFAEAAMDAALLAGVRVPDAAYLEAARRTESTLITADRAQLAGALRLGLAALPLSEVPARDT